MLYTASVIKTDVFKELVDKLRRGENTDIVFQEIQELCDNCQPSTPIMCVELCPIWKLKQQYQDSFQALKDKRSLLCLLNLLKNDRRLKIFETLEKKPCTLKEVRDYLKPHGYYHSFSILTTSYLKPLLEAHLLEEKAGVYNITSKGKTLLTIYTNSDLPKLILSSKEYEKDILEHLLTGSKTHKELSNIVPKNSLYRSLKTLQSMDLIVKSPQRGRIFYYATKRRPTRRLSPIESILFKALPKEGISIRDLSQKVGISIQRIYKYLKRLQYKRHVKKIKREALYNITHAGKHLLQQLKMATNLLQSQ